MKVFVVTYPELGWDCIVGVFSPSTLTREQLKQQFPEDQYIIAEKTVETNLDDYD